ncbi:MAG TPA: N,N-dimethylformamidase beta subunit family domain-containing protein, partial [Polyangiaceae bacterium]
MGVLLCGLLSAAAFADTAIQRENALPGTTGWQVRSSDRVALYGSQIGIAPGEHVDIHVSTQDRYRLAVYRLGWYGGAGARLVTCVPGCDADEQGQPGPQVTIPDGPASTAPPIRAGWPVTDSIQSDPSWTSGYYLVEAVLTNGPDQGRAATTFFILRESQQAVGSRVLVQVPVNTWEAYNRWGGKSLYDFYGPRAYRVSFDRPFGQMAQTPMWWEIQLVRFLEREGYDASYQTDRDTDVDPGSLLRHRAVLVAGHDEYWTSGIRAAFDSALAQGTNLAFMGSNDGYWRIKYEDDGRTIFGYKSLYDPAPALEDKTALFREIGSPECILMGVLHQSLVSLPSSLDYTVTDAGAADPWLAGTGFAAGDKLAAVVGREHDVINPYPESCFHPGLTTLFHYDGQGVDQNADAVRFTAPSGARV